MFSVKQFYCLKNRIPFVRRLIGSFKSEFIKLHFERRFLIERKSQVKRLSVNQFNDLYFSHFDGQLNVEHKNQIEIVIEQYNLMMNSSWRVPIELTSEHMIQLMSHSNDKFMIRRLIDQFFDDEFNNWINSNRHLISEFRLENSNLLWKQSRFPPTDDPTQRIGCFNVNNDLVYGLWHNSLFIRMKNKHLNRLKFIRCSTFTQFNDITIVIQINDEIDDKMEIQFNNLLKNNFDINFVFINQISCNQATLNRLNQYLNVQIINSLDQLNQSNYILIHSNSYHHLNDAHANHVFVLNLNDQITECDAQAKRIQIDKFCDSKIKLNLNEKISILKLFKSFQSIECAIKNVVKI